MTPSPPGPTAAAARAKIVALCAAGLPALELLDRVAARVRQVVPHAGGCWDLTDPATLLPTGAVTTDLPAQLYLGVLDHELLEEDFATIRHLARQPRPVLTLHEATSGAPERSSRYRRYAQPMGMSAELRAVFRTGQACWGSACLIRHQTQPPFSPGEVEFVNRLCGHIGHGLRTAHLLDAARASDVQGAPGMVVLADDDSIESMSATAEYWLRELPTDRGQTLELPIVVYGVARRARQAAAGAGAGALEPATARVQLPSGRWLLAHAAVLRGADGTPRHTAVILEPAKPAQIAPLLLDLHELTGRERQISQLLVRGLGTDDIARQLWISPHTVRDHIKATFGKLGVTSRPELTALLFYDHALPTIDPTQLPRPATIQASPATTLP